MILCVIVQNQHKNKQLHANNKLFIEYYSQYINLKNCHIRIYFLK